ncbi:hypothetical protein A6V36_36995 [Paraburkholderia ginsengiterrae]|uniref:Uncharacterized protein n=1 Tax=Paraburkholderia ginsengiterrae TaxID=1462993 RepID=A0A1A9N0N3_9BURK|nr:hypothetical protein A6V36_36995 [Paraburkholderia ginsengiterrae]OAJ55313.1 hypothetical protein A6V37_33060 [Paraburkholderia ginsengiterrae]
MIRDGLGAVPVAVGPTFVCHVIPLTPLPPGHIEPTSLDLAADELEWARPGGHRLLPRRFFRGAGRVCISERTQDAVCNGYAQLFDDGAIELVGTVWTDLDSPDGQPVLYPGLYEGSLHEHGMPSVTRAWTRLGLTGPLWLSVSLVGLGTGHVAIPDAITRRNGFWPLRESVPGIMGVPMQLDSMGEATPSALRPTLDALIRALSAQARI